MKADFNALITAFGGGSITHEEFRNKLKISPEQAHRELFEAYCNYVFTIVFNRLRSCASREDIEECVCDVFADVYIYYDSEKETEGNISGFIGTIARRKSGELFKRKTGRLPELSLDDETSEELPSSSDTEHEAELHTLQSKIIDTIITLGDPDSTILIQKYYYGRTFKEISQMLPLTPENIKVRANRALKKLKSLLDH